MNGHDPSPALPALAPERIAATAHQDTPEILGELATGRGYGRKVMLQAWPALERFPASRDDAVAVGEER